MGKKRIKIIFMILTLTFLIIPMNVYAQDSDDCKLTIIHINDRHGRMSADPYISRMAKDIKEKGGNVLVLDAGDTLHGQTAANLSKGEAMAVVMNAAGYNAMAPGNHDFNFGVPRLLELSGQMEFPLLAANVKDSKGENLFQSYEVFKMSGITVGVFGLATPDTLIKSDPRIVAGLTFEGPEDTAAQMVKTLKAEGCDLIVALAHLGTDYLPEFSSDGIDVIIDGHSHTALENGRISAGTLTAQAGANAEYFGVIEITLKNGVISKKTAKLEKLPLEGEETKLLQDQNIIDKITEENAKIQTATEAVIGYTPELLQGDREYVRTGETNLANLITDSMRYATNADIAFLTGGNIRSSIEAGNITMGQVLTVLPFSNLLVTVELSGKDLLTALEHGVSSYPEPVGQHIQVSGLKFEFDPKAQPMSRVSKVTLADGGAFDTNKSYTVATIEFLAAGGDGYDMISEGNNMVYYQGDADAFAEYLAAKPEISAEPEYRVKAVSADDIDKNGGTDNPKTAVECAVFPFVLSALGLFTAMNNKQKLK